MLKRLILIFGLGVFSNVAFGQAAILALLIGDKVATEKFNISMELGAGLSNYTEVVPDHKLGLAVNFGMACNIKLNESWYLNPSIYFFAQRGQRLEDAKIIQDEYTSGFPLTADAVMSVKYIDIPVFVNYRIAESPWRVGLAPQLSIPTNSSIKYELNDKESYERSNTDNLSKATFGMMASVSYVVSSGRDGKGLILGLRYYQGMSNTLDGNSLLTSGNATGSYFAVNLSFPFITDALAAENKKP